VIDLREEQKKNPRDSMRINSESVSNEIHERNLQSKSIPNKGFEQDEEL
jgi:hypothetical protein